MAKVISTEEIEKASVGKTIERMVIGSASVGLYFTDGTSVDINFLYDLGGGFVVEAENKERMTKVTLEQLEKRSAEQGCATMRNGELEGLIMCNGSEFCYYVQGVTEEVKRTLSRYLFAKLMGV